MKKIAGIICLLSGLLFSLHVESQICSGTINTVWKDDFGSGTSQLSPSGSNNITNGYTYENNGVEEGHYALVNRFDYFGSWHIVPEDHTPGDAGGYFLVIDGNSSVLIFYDVVVNDLCPNTRYSFSTAAMNIDLPAFPSNQTFTFIISDTSGNQLYTWDSPPISITDTPQWNKLGFSFLSGSNSALRLQVKFNQTGYDDFAFDDFEFSICGPTLSINSPFVNNSCSDSIPLFSSLGSGYTTPVYQWQKKNAAGLFVNIAGATNASYTDWSVSDSNFYRLVIGDGSLSCPIIAEKLLVKNCITSSRCNNWLHIPNSQSYVTVGEIDIPGTQITVEGLFSRDSALTPEGYTSLNIVSKHWTPADVNYLLRVDRAQVTTTNGHFMTPDICELTNKKIYHAAMTYDGAMLKFYRNGFLMSQIPCTGTMFQNDYLTTIAATANSPTTNTQLIGYLNEIRIWNVAKTQAELQQYINSPLPNPTTQTGLLAYYTFDNLNNKQGNTAWDGTLHGAATINNIVPNCNFFADSCLTITNANIKGIINDYAAVSTIDICNNSITVDDATKFKTGDTIVIMQMKGAAIDSFNSSNFGTITSYNNAGLYEFNYVKNKTGNTIELLNTFLNQYDAAVGKVQIIRVPYFQTINITDTLTCLAWNGFKGGVLIINSATDVNLNADIDVSNKGFRGGAVGGGFSCGNINAWAAPTGTGGTKGEGITEYITGFEAGGARLANGGGGAYAANSGGGGGGNWGAGGLGGFHSNTCPSTTQSINGLALDYSTNNKIFLGGGGGGGQQDNGAPVAAGGNGGGIVIIKAATLNSNNQTITANGETITTMVEDEGGAGGGAGGSVILFVNNYTGTLNAELKGGDGSSNRNQIYPTRCHGPGGGGGGGYFGISTNGVLPPASIAITTEGGRAGTVQNPNSACANTTNGATDGTNGAVTFNLVLQQAIVPFKKNIDSVRIKDSITSCKSFDFKGLPYVNTNPIQNWQWSFDDGSIENTQNTAHTYTTYGLHNVKLVITDVNGCKDSTTKVVNTNGLNFDFTFEQDACNPLSINFNAIGGTTPEIFWSLGDGTIINNIRNPLYVYADTGSYLVQYSTGNINTGCIDTVKKIIFIGYRNANIILTPDTGICFGANKLLRSNIDSALQFCWSPNSFLNNINFANPTTNTPSGITYTLLAASEESNLIINGNFTNGNTGFATDYDAGSTPLSTAEYIVTTSSLNAGPLTIDCKDHTTGSGNMMVVRNNFSTSAQIWGQSVSVLRNTNYMFSAWVQSLAQPNNAQLQFSINGNVALDNIATATSTCTWTKHFIVWNSGNNTTANLSIFNKATTAGADNYFAIDDISFSLYFIKKDSIRITVDTPFLNTRTDTSVCESISVQLNTIGSATYSWTPTTGLSNASIASPMATPTVSTKYFVTGTSTFGCTAIDSVTISIKPKPVVTSTGDTSICRNTTADLFAAGGVSYSWSPASLFNNPNIANPVAIPTIVNTKYVVAVTGANNCISKDSFMVNVKALPVFSLSPDKSVCLNDKAQLTASGGDYYLWSPASSVSNANIPNPLAIATVTTPYSVLIRDTLCGYDTTLFTNIIVLPVPTIAASKENDINCAIGSTQLTATGALQYNWTPAASLNDATSPTPIASPANTTTYTVKGTDIDGCSNTATVIVLADYSNKVTYSMPNAFTPNGDDKNDCFRIKYFGLVQEIQLTIYNRFGEKVFFTTNPNDCWDGTYKGAVCDPGNFVYYLKAKTTCGNVERKGNVILIR